MGMNERREAWISKQTEIEMRRLAKKAATEFAIIVTATVLLCALCAAAAWVIA